MKNKLIAKSLITLLLMLISFIYNNMDNNNTINRNLHSEFAI
ncbi:hypothetical protein B462_01104, partial [Staphylococcus aureus M0792]